MYLLCHTKTSRYYIREWTGGYQGGKGITQRSNSWTLRNYTIALSSNPSSPLIFLFISPDKLIFTCNYPPGFVAEVFSPSWISVFVVECFCSTGGAGKWKSKFAIKVPILMAMGQVLQVSPLQWSTANSTIEIQHEIKVLRPQPFHTCHTWHESMNSSILSNTFINT